MNLRQRRFFVAFWVAVTVSYWIWANLGGESQTYRGLWHVWHPYTLAALAVVPVIGLMPSFLRTIIGFGAWKSSMGRALIFVTAGLTLWAGPGMLFAFWYLTCDTWPVLSCGTGYGGTLPVPSLSDFATALAFPFYCIGLFFLTKLMAVGRHDLFRLGWIPIPLLMLNLWLALPFGMGIVMKEWNTTVQSLFALYFVIADVATTSWTLILIVVSRRISGGMFMRPVLVTGLALIFLLVGDTTFAEHFRTGEFSIASVPVFMYGLSVMLMSLALVEFGGVLERLNAPVVNNAQE